MHRKTMKYSATWLWAGAMAVMLTAVAVPAHSQAVAIGNATATVLASLSVTAAHDLEFGDVLQGVQKIADKTVIADAGVFQINGAGGNEVSMTLSLPPFLWNNTPGNEDRLLVSFSDTHVDIDTTLAGTPAAHGAGALVNQNPHNLPDTPIGGADNIIQIYLGGTCYPTIDQRAGFYTADIVLTVSYTGT